MTWTGLRPFKTNKMSLKIGQSDIEYFFEFNSTNQQKKQWGKSDKFLMRLGTEK